MYLQEALIENSGPLRRLAMKTEFSPDGSPKPVVLVGSNGSGKTNFLSLITDAMFEAAAVHYSDVLPAHSAGRSWFRIVGARTLTVGQQGGFSLLRFQHENVDLFYKEKAGHLDPDGTRHLIDHGFRNIINWPIDGSFKEFNVTDDQSREIYEKGVYAYFPSSRSEIPYWLNLESIPEVDFDIRPAIAKRLKRPIYVERSIHNFKQWLLSVIFDSRCDVEILPDADGKLRVNNTIPGIIQNQKVLDQCNKILQFVLGDDEVRFVWLGRNNSDKIAVAKNNNLFLPNLDALSDGQSILLGLFGTLLRYTDAVLPGYAFDISRVKGICVVDEIDAHIHVDLQNRILPQLIALFPKVQFFISSHSPLFALGMREVFGNNGFQLIEMPSGTAVTSEAYSEFARAMQVLYKTETFNKKLISEASRSGRPIVFLEGETDRPYLQKAFMVLGREDLDERCELMWIGAKDDKGQVFHTGKSGLDHTLAFLRANPGMIGRPILLLYDNDAKKPPIDYGVISVRSMPTNPKNELISAGIENLLSPEFIEEGDYDLQESKKPNGDVVTLRTLKKQALCDRLCNKGGREAFAHFDLALDLIDRFLKTQNR